MGLSTVGGGLTVAKLKLANAKSSDVISGKKFYAEDKILKTGTLEKRNGYKDVTDVVRVDPNILVRIPSGAYVTPTSSGKPEIRIPTNNVVNVLPGGNRGAWGTTIDPGSSVAIPQGYHNGAGRVYANSASSKVRVETGRETWNFNIDGHNNPWRKTFSGSIVAFGLTNVDQDGGNTSVQSQSGNSVTVVNYSVTIAVTFEWIAAYYI